MKVTIPILISLLALFSSATQAQSENTCIQQITKGYFHGFKQVLESEGSNLHISLKNRKQAIQNLLTFLDEANIKSCKSKSSRKLNTLHIETRKYLNVLEQLIKDIESGKQKGLLPDDYNKSRQKYNQMNIVTIRALKKETGIMWQG